MPDEQKLRTMRNRIFYVKDHPEALARVPQKGEHGYTLKFPLADGTELQVLCGEETLNYFREFLGSMDLDTMEEKRDA